MSIAFVKCGSDTSRFESTPVIERIAAAPAVEAEEDDRRSSASTTTSSSIGRNSDDVSGRSSDGGDCVDEDEVQSSYNNNNNGGLNMMDSLQQVLPMRRGISSFYAGKSKSFTNLADASSSSSIKEIAKPENSYTRKRRNLLAMNHLLDRNGNHKRPIRPISSSKSTMALAVGTMSSSESISSTSDDSTISISSPRQLPPLPPQTRTSFNNFNTASSGRNLSGWRSFSLADVREHTAVIGSTLNPDCDSYHDEN